MTLEDAVKDFEASFELILEGTIPVSQTREKYIEICSDFGNTKEEAIASWRNAVKPFFGKKVLYWRIRPEIAQDSNIKWLIYSRFLSSDLTPN